MIDRRTFLEIASGAALGAGWSPAPAFGQGPPAGPSRIRLGIAGCGARGLAIARLAGTLPTCDVRAVADVYSGRRARALEVIGKDVPALDDARALVSRDDIDAVVIAIPDHLHARLIEAAIGAGKDVTCEAPATHLVAETLRLQGAKPARVVQVVTGAFTTGAYAAARRLVESGALGRVVFATTTWDTSSSLHAWQAPYPPDASEESIAYAAFLGHTAPRAFDPACVFRWPTFNAFGSGVIGMRIVPQVAAVHAMLGLPAPDSVSASGGITRWRDGRDTEDLVTATFDYPSGTTVIASASLTGAGRPNEIRLVGTDATLVITPQRLTLHDAPANEPYPEAAETWPKGYRDWFYMMHGMSRDGLVRGVPEADRVAQVYDVPDGAGSATAALGEFLEAVRSRGTVRESLALGLDATLAGQMVTRSLRERRQVRRSDMTA